MKQIKTKSLHIAHDRKQHEKSIGAPNPPKYANPQAAFGRYPAAVRSRPDAEWKVGPLRLTNNLLLARCRRRVTQKTLADKVGISQTALSNIETGKSVPSVGTALVIAKQLGTTVEELFSIVVPRFR